MDGSNKVRVIGEAFMVGETHEAYKVVLDTLLEFTPSRSRNSIMIVAGDCILTDDFMSTLDLPNAKLIWNR